MPFMPWVFKNEGIEGLGLGTCRGNTTQQRRLIYISYVEIVYESNQGLDFIICYKKLTNSYLQNHSNIKKRF